MAKAAKSLWTREAPKRRTTLSRDDIVLAAIAIADTDGLAVVSLRRVASALKTRATSLYTYMDSKDELLALMVGHLAGELLVHERLPVDWRDAIVVLAKRQRAVALRHPWVVDLADKSDPTANPNGLRSLDQRLGVLAGLGGDIQRRGEALRAILSFVSGFVAHEISLAAKTRPHARHTFAAAVRALEPAVAKGELTHLTELVSAKRQSSDDDDFERGLRWLLAGIEADTKRRR